VTFEGDIDLLREVVHDVCGDEPDAKDMLRRMTK